MGTGVSINLTMQQVAALIGMEPPVCLSANDFRDEKLKVLRCIPPISVNETVLGQYENYCNEPGVTENSVTPTYAACKLCVQNKRWAGVPWILKCGKALNERKAEIRVQFLPSATFLFDNNALPNELVIRIQPNEAIYVKLMTKVPGIGGGLVQSELDLSYQTRFDQGIIPDAYEHLLRDVVRGDHSLFVRSDELQAAWKIFTPLLMTLEEKHIKPLEYQWGSRGPPEADKMASEAGFVYTSKDYTWPQAKTKKNPPPPPSPPPPHLFSS
ncbi:glucose 6-phosphate-1-dehydrogenase [Pelomyxa schiedti]|nr:glucose 6-phosphate-1-dehydrogenase [Pelomyxa schiedti]